MSPFAVFAVFVRRVWNQYFYAEGSALSYSWFGSAFYWYVCGTAILSPLARPWAFEPLFVRDIFLFRVLHLEHPSDATLLLVVHGWWLSLAFSGAGILGRPMRFLCFLLGAYVCGQKQNFGLVFDQESTLMLSLIVMTAAPAFPYTMVGWLRSRNAEAAPGQELQYRWPLQLVRLILVYILFSAALLKLYFGGFSWFSGNIIYEIATNPQHHRRTGFAIDWLAAHEGVCRVATVSSILLELSFPLALFLRPLRAPLTGAALLMFLGIWLVVKMHFLFYMGPLFLAFLPWERIENFRLA